MNPARCRPVGPLGRIFGDAAKVRSTQVHQSFGGTERLVEGVVKAAATVCCGTNDGDSMDVPMVASVFLLAENRLLREALIRLLSKKNDIYVVGANPYSPSAHEEIVATRPGIIVLDSSGLTFSNPRLIPTLHSAIPGVRVVMVDMDLDEESFLSAIREGVVGYVLKDASALEVIATIRAVAAGVAVCPPGLSMVLFRSVARQIAVQPAVMWGADLGLSRREHQLLELLRERLTNKEIAVRLNLAEQTVKNHVHRILRKVGAPNRLTVIEHCEVEGFGSRSAASTVNG
jgi:two-component system response regulator DevR